MGISPQFSYISGVRQGSVPSPRLIFRNAAVDGQPALMDLRFADGILLFATSYAETVLLFHGLVIALSQVGFILNANKTVILTTDP